MRRIGERMAHQSFTLVRTKAIYERPYLGSALASLHPVEVKGLGKMTGDLWWRLYFDPEWLTTLVDNNMGEAAWEMLHIVTHLLRIHGERAERIYAQSKIWDIASDEEINDDINAVRDYAENTRLSTPKGAIHPSMFGHDPGNLTEEYYMDLLDKCEEGGGGEGDGDGGSGDLDEALSKASDGAIKEYDGGSGSCATGKPLEHEQTKPAEGNSPGVQKTKGDLIRRKVASDITEHSRSRGDTPAGWQRWADEILNPQVPWDKVLKQKIRQGLSYASGMVDYTFSRPSRRQGGQKIIMPSLRRPRQRVGLVVDTSGSMSDKDMGLALGSIRGVLKAVGEDGCTVVSADADVHECKQVFTEKQVRLFGGGGTDMRVPIRYFEKLPRAKKPDVLVIVTDGYTPWPDKGPRNMHVVTLLVEDGDAPPFGTIVRRHNGAKNDEEY
jgi:predicted metal-dependent peptidase